MGRHYGVRSRTSRAHRAAPRESTPRVPEHAIHSCTREGNNGLAGHSGRCGGFRGGCAARLRSRPGRGSSDRQGAGGAAGLWIGARKAPESLKGGELPESAAQGRASRSSQVAKETFIESKGHATKKEGTNEKSVDPRQPYRVCAIPGCATRLRPWLNGPPHEVPTTQVHMNVER